MHGTPGVVSDAECTMCCSLSRNGQLSWGHTGRLATEFGFSLFLASRTSWPSFRGGGGASTISELCTGRTLRKSSSAARWGTILPSRVTILHTSCGGSCRPSLLCIPNNDWPFRSSSTRSASVSEAWKARIPFDSSLRLFFEAGRVPGWDVGAVGALDSAALSSSDSERSCPCSGVAFALFAAACCLAKPEAIVAERAVREGSGGSGMMADPTMPRAHKTRALHTAALAPGALPSCSVPLEDGTTRVLVLARTRFLRQSPAKFCILRRTLLG